MEGTWRPFSGIAASFKPIEVASPSTSLQMLTFVTLAPPPGGHPVPIRLLAGPDADATPRIRLQVGSGDARLVVQAIPGATVEADAVMSVETGVPSALRLRARGRHDDLLRVVLTLREGDTEIGRLDLLQGEVEIETPPVASSVLTLGIAVALRRGAAPTDVVIAFSADGP